MAIIVTAFRANPADIRRDGSGQPQIRAQSGDALLCLATPTDTGWAIETWIEQDGGQQQRLSLADDITELSGQIAVALAAFAAATDNDDTEE